MFKKLCLIATLLALSIPGAYAAVQVGQPAPAFTAQDISGKEQSLAAYKGKIVVLEWNNPGCPFCKKHYDSNNMQTLQKYALAHGVVWLTVDSSGPGKEGYMDTGEAKSTVASLHGQETAYILDPHGTLGKLYGATATPHMFVIGADGKLAYSGAIDDKATASQDDIKTAHNYVKAAIDALLAGKPVETSYAHVYGCSVKYE